MTKWQVYRGYDYVANRPRWVVRSVTKSWINEFFDTHEQAMNWLEVNGAKF